MSDTLRERVVAEMMASVGCERFDNTEWRAYCLMADAAIALIRAEVLEEAARVAEREGVYPELNIYNGGPEWYRHGKRIAAAIRALKEKGQTNG